MSMSNNLFLAILAMDSYNRGYNAGIAGLGGTGTEIGNATVSSNSGILGTGVDSNASFFAQAYTIGDNSIAGFTQGQTIISYRGTDNISLSGDIPAWTTGAGVYETAQAQLAAQFYKKVNGDSIAANPNIILTGHSLGGGLAGLVGSIYGVTARFFDNMPFEAAANRLYNNSIIYEHFNENGASLGSFADDSWARQFYFNGADHNHFLSRDFQGPLFREKSFRHSDCCSRCL